MKKALLIMLALVLITSVAFAQAGVKIGAWGRGFLEIAGSSVDGQKPTIDPAIGWWTGNGPRIGISIIGSSESVGFQIDMNVDPNGLNLTTNAVDTLGNPATISGTLAAQPIERGDQQKIWVKPISMVTVQLGYSCYDDALRGNASFGIYNWIRLSGMPGDGFIFQRVGAASNPYSGDSGGSNFEIAINPVDGAEIFAAFTPGAGNAAILEDAVKSNAMYGAGYTIPGIGQIRLQYLGETKDYGAINAAFKLTAVSGLTVDLGGWIPTDAKFAPTLINLTASYAVMPTLTLNAIGSIGLVSEDLSGYSGGYIAWYGGIEGEYALPMDLVATVDLRLQGTTVTDSKTGWGGLLAIQKNFSNGLIGLGFELTNFGFAGPVPSLPGDLSKIGWAVPLRLEYWF